MFIAWLALGLTQRAHSGAEVLPASAHEIVFEGTAAGEAAEALDDLRAGRFESAGRRFTALADVSGTAELRYLQGVSLYEAGDLARAAQATQEGLARDPQHAALGSLRGLVLADLGRGEEALSVLGRAQAAAKGDVLLVARIEVNRALVHLDRGEADAAEAALKRAAPGADEALRARIDDNQRQVAALRGGSADTDLLGTVGQRLSAGDVGGAAAALPKAPPADLRGRIRLLIARASIAKTEGRFAEAQRLLAEAASEASAHGLLRELAAAEGQLGVVFGANNRPELGVIELERAIARIDGTSLRVLLQAYRTEAARLAVRSGEAPRARAHLNEARAIVTSDPAAQAAMLEVEASLAEVAGDRAAAAAKLSTAGAIYEQRGAWLDAARVHCAVIALEAGFDDAATAAAKQGALAAFTRAGDRLGPVHVGVSEGLGLAERGQVEPALRAFGEAITAADKTGTDRGKALGQLARENAARLVADQTDSTAVLAQMKDWNIEALVARNRKYVEARSAYETAHKQYDAHAYAEAFKHFDLAVRNLEAIGETGYALTARRGRAWAQYNALASASPVDGYPKWQALVEEASMLRDNELRVRSMGAVGIAAVALKRPEASRSLRAAATEAESMGLLELAGQCHAARVEVAEALPDKVAAARRAMALLQGDETAVYALYSASVAAYEGGDLTLAQKLAAEALPLATGALADSLRQVAAAAAQGQP